MRGKSTYKKVNRKPDYIYDRLDIGRFISYLMTAGRRTKAEKTFYDALAVMEKTSKEDPVKIFEKAVANASPLLETVSRRVGGANYQVPREVRPERKFFLGSNWIIKAARSKKGKPMSEKLAEEILAAAKNEGAAIKKKLDTHRVAEANRAFASFGRQQQ